MRSLVLLLVILAGCPGTLENPDQYPEEPLALCQLDVDVPALLHSRCGPGCHEGDTPDGELDLVAPGVFERLENVAATGCEDRVLVDPLEPNSSFLIEKLRGTQPSGCGERMPRISFLTGAEIGCVQRWVFDQTIGIDGGARPPVDMGTVDDDMGGSSEQDMDMVSDPDMGPGDPDMGATLDCSLIDADANGQVCTARADGCEVLSLNNTSCDDTCALAGLTCSSAFDNLGCAADMAITADCSTTMYLDYFCVCD